MTEPATTAPALPCHPPYGRVWLTFVRNSLVREMTFRGNFLITIVTRAFWFAAQLVLFGIIYGNVKAINDWSQWEYFAFMATGMLINAFVEAFFMPNCANFSELIRKGDLDFVLLKPIDTQFLVSFEKVEIAMLNQVLLAGCLLGYSLFQLGGTVSTGASVEAVRSGSPATAGELRPGDAILEIGHENVTGPASFAHAVADLEEGPQVVHVIGANGLRRHESLNIGPNATPATLGLTLGAYERRTSFVTTTGVLMYLLLVACGVAFFYSLMIILASTSVWFGRNQGLYDFWFYMTVFARYPRSIYSGSVAGEMMRFTFSYVIPILLVVTVPARVLLGKALDPSWLAAVAVVAALLALVVSRAVFTWSLKSYRSASS